MPTVFITGSSRGLGLEFVRQYAEDNWSVIASCREPLKAEKLQALSKAHKNIRIEALDVCDEKAIKQLAKKLASEAIDLLINNAGIYSGSPLKGQATDHDESQAFGSLDAEAWVKVLRANSIAPIMLIEAFLPNLIKSTGRKVVNITSRMGSIAEMGANYLAYRSSKAALNAAMRVIAHDLKTEKIAIINLHPGWVKTDMGGSNASLEIPKSIGFMRKTIADIGLKDTSQFLNYDGKVIQW